MLGRYPLVAPARVSQKRRGWLYLRRASTPSGPPGPSPKPPYRSGLWKPAASHTQDRVADVTSPDRGSANPCGSRAAYAAGCRCDSCREANAVYIRKWRAGAPGYLLSRRSKAMDATRARHPSAASQT